MTVRSLIEQALSDLESEFGGSGAAISELHDALSVLDASREITDKETLGPVPDGAGYGRFFKVVNHKARVVWDD